MTGLLRMYVVAGHGMSYSLAGSEDGPERKDKGDENLDKYPKISDLLGEKACGQQEC